MTKSKKAAIGAVAVAVALSLSGCVKIVSNIVLHEDDTVSGEYIFALENQYAEGMSEGDILSQLGGDEATSGMVNARTESYSDGTYTGTKTIFEDEPLESAISDGSVVREGDVFRYTGTAPSSDDLSGVTEGAIITMSITFPGAVTEHNGSLSGTTVTWDLFTMTEAPFAVGGAVGSGDDAGVPGSSSGGGIPTWVWLALGAAVVIGVVYFVSKRGKAAPAEVAPAPEAPAAEKKAADKK